MSTRIIQHLLLGTCLLACRQGLTDVTGQEANYDESRVPQYTLPDPLKTEDGTTITTAADWQQRRRPELLRLFEQQMFGRAPGKPSELHWYVFDDDRQAMQGTAIRKQVTIYFTAAHDGPRMDLLLYLPTSAAQQPVPVFLGLNFRGNHATTDDPQVRLSQSWLRAGDQVENNRATEASRGSDKSAWPVADILNRGYGLGVIYYGDIDPDFDDGFQNGVHAIYHGSGQAQPAADEWGSIATWAWGLSRALDYLSNDPHVAKDRVAVVGHSRLGKTALWAGANDERFALVISNNSGCGGAALSKRAFGETVQRINTAFPHWFCDNFNQYSGREDRLPFDQHELIALIAPRPVLVCSAEEDRWADPRGEFLSVRFASPVFRLFGAQGIEQADPPALNQLTGDRAGYFIRPGKHEMSIVDWHAYLDYADRYLKP